MTPNIATSNMTKDDTRTMYVDVMGPELGVLQHDLQNELAWLRKKWDEFGALYKEDVRQVELLNEVASNFFYFLQKLLYEDAMLHISRLTDPPNTGRRNGPSNLTLRRLPLSVIDPDLKSRVEASVREACSRAEFARQWRDKRLAHTDLDIHRKGVAAALPEVKRDDIQRSLDAMCEPVRQVNDHFGQQSELYTLPDPWGAKALLYHLQIAVDRGRAQDDDGRVLTLSDGT
jgi:hypothetical protein